MSAHERAVRLLTDRIEAHDPGYGREVALTTCELCREASRPRQCLELLSLAALVLRLRARGCERPDAVWRQGLYAGAVLLLGDWLCRTPWRARPIPGVSAWRRCSPSRPPVR